MGKFQFYAEKPVGEYRKADPLFIVSVLLLWGLGIFTLFIASSSTANRIFKNENYFVMKQLIWSVIGFGVMIFTALFPMRLIRKYVPYIVVGSIVLCVLVAILGSMLNGASRWFTFGSVFSMQPSELAKFALVLFLANYFAKDTDIQDKKRTLYYPLVGLFLFAVCIAIQRDLSTTILVVLAGLAMFFVVNAKMAWFFPLLGLIIMGTVLLIGSEKYRLERIMAWISPENFTQDSAYQLLSSRAAISSGGIWGNGMGSGLSKVYKIPEVQSDYIFAGFASALGLVGVIIYLFLLGFFCYRALKICMSTPSAFAAYGSFGCMAMILFQSMVNIGVASGAFPTTGINLPFFSSGGSSLVITFMMCGFIINASHCDGEDDYISGSTNLKNRDYLDSLVVEYE